VIARNQQSAEQAAERIRRAYRIGPEAVTAPQLLRALVTTDGVRDLTAS